MVDTVEKATLSRSRNIGARARAEHVQRVFQIAVLS